MPLRTRRKVPRLPGTAPGATRRNFLVVLCYLFAFALLVSLVVGLV